MIQKPGFLNSDTQEPDPNRRRYVVATRHHASPPAVASFARRRLAVRPSYSKTTCQPDEIRKTMISEFARSGICPYVLSDNSRFSFLAIRRQRSYRFRCAPFWRPSWYWPFSVGWPASCLRHRPPPIRWRIRRSGDVPNRAGNGPTNGRRSRHHPRGFCPPHRPSTR